MITGLVHVPRTGEAALEALADTLAALVAGVAAGLVGDAVVIVPAPDPAIAAVVEATGATLVIAPPGTDPWRAGAAAARREWLLCLAAGDVPAEGWIRIVDRFVAAERGPGAIGRIRRGRGLRACLSALLRARGAAGAGDVLHRESLRVAPRDPQAPRRRVRRLPTRIAPAAQR